MCKRRNYTQKEKDLMEHVRTTYKPICYYCGKKLSNEEKSVDHKIPLIRGGKTVIENLAITCKECNVDKNCLTDKEYLHYRATNDWYYKKAILYTFSFNSIIKGYIVKKDDGKLDNTTYLDIDNIIVRGKVSEPKKVKVQRKIRYYNKHGYFDKQITVDSNNNIIDGYISYMLYRKMGVNNVPVQIKF